MGHASIRVTKDVYRHLMPKARAKAAEAMRSVLYDQSNPARSFVSAGLATQTATSDVADNYSEAANRTFVGRPGLDPGTLGLKGHRVHYSLFIRFREPHIHRVLRSVRSLRSVAIEKC